MNVSTRIKTRCWLCFAFLSALACAPEGDLQRTLHPANKRYLDRQAPASPPTGAALPPDTIIQTKGLPEACSFSSPKPLCMHCQSEEWVVERCYDFKGPIDPQIDCQYTADHVKCLTRFPPFALYLDWRISHEKFLRENYLLWQDTVHQIWDDKLSAEDREESERILKSLDWLTTILSTKAGIESSDGETWVKLLGLEPGTSPRAQDLIVSLQQSRLAGKLTLALMLEKVGDFYMRTHGTSNLWEDLRTMSLEGLEN